LPPPPRERALSEPRPPHLLPVEVGLTAAIVAVRGDEPLIRIAPGGSEPALPSGPFDPVAHRTFEIGLREWVTQQTGAPLGYVEQLYTFGDRGRHARAGDRDPHVVSVGYLALTRAASGPGAAHFQPWYRFFPWEDARLSHPPLLDAAILPALKVWAQRGEGATPASGESAGTGQGTWPTRRERVRQLFGLDGAPFNEENVLERYELLYSAGLVAEAARDGRPAKPIPGLGQSMRHDHRRILATAMGRLRAKLKYRPVIFELMPSTFTLTHLQRTVEAISGRHVHTQNFRRLVEAAQVVEPTGQMSYATGGRPAALYRFRHEVLRERPALGLRVGRS
jgi:hypothetical protein